MLINIKIISEMEFVRIAQNHWVHVKYIKLVRGGPFDTQGGGGGAL